jgi:hypothetical protein
MSVRSLVDSSRIRLFGLMKRAIFPSDRRMVRLPFGLYRGIRLELELRNNIQTYALVA